MIERILQKLLLFSVNECKILKNANWSINLDIKTGRSGMKPEVIIAICALVTSVVSLGFSIYFGWCIRDHSRRSVKPLPYVAPSDFENLLAVRLWNYGTGPMILQKVMSHNYRDELSGHLIDLLPSLPNGLHFNNYVKVQSGRAIPPGESLDLFEFSIDDIDTNAIAYRDKLRIFLSQLVIYVNYTDIYETTFSTYKRDLTWFQRNKS
jgi:hypothetical protein